MTQPPMDDTVPAIGATPAVKAAVENAQLLVAYASETGLDVDQEILSALVTAKYRLLNNQWNPQAETEFWAASNQMANRIQPVTIRTLKASMEGYGEQGVTDAVRAVRRSKTYTVITLVILLTLHLYWHAGAQILNSLDDLIGKTDQLRQQVRNYEDLARQGDPDDDTPKPTQLESARADLEDLQRQVDAGFDGLQTWNDIWRLAVIRGPISGEFSEVDTQRLDIEVSRIQARVDRIRDRLNDNDLTQAEKYSLDQQRINLTHQIKKLQLQPKEHEARDIFFETKQSARMALVALQHFILPLFYGFLGALCFVLRDLSDRIRVLTYSRDCDVKFRLRIILGGPSGMIAGWLIHSGAMVNSTGLSPFLVALLIGYNVDALFSMMDRFIAGFSTAEDAPKPNPAASKEDKPAPKSQPKPPNPTPSPNEVT